jgi:hypothetical protein
MAVPEARLRLVPAQVAFLERLVDQVTRDD